MRDLIKDTHPFGIKNENLIKFLSKHDAAWGEIYYSRLQVAIIAHGAQTGELLSMSSFYLSDRLQSHKIFKSDSLPMLGLRKVQHEFSIRQLYDRYALRQCASEEYKLSNEAVLMVYTKINLFAKLL